MAKLVEVTKTIGPSYLELDVLRSAHAVETRLVAGDLYVTLCCTSYDPERQPGVRSAVHDRLAVLDRQRGGGMRYEIARTYEQDSTIWFYVLDKQTMAVLGQFSVPADATAFRKRTVENDVLETALGECARLAGKHGGSVFDGSGAWYFSGARPGTYVLLDWDDKFRVGIYEDGVEDNGEGPLLEADDPGQIEQVLKLLVRAPGNVIS